MTVLINGTTGISGTNGSAGTPAVQGEDTNTGVFFPAADTIAFAEGGAEVARFDANGRLGIGTTSPAVKLHLGGSSDQSFEIDGSLTPTFVGTSGSVGQISVNRRPHDGIFADTGKAAAYINLSSEAGGSTITFSTTTTNNVNPSERARIDSSGTLLVGQTTRGTPASPGTGASISPDGEVYATFNTASAKNTYHLYNQNAVNNGYRFYVADNGGIRNYSANNTNLSDERVKIDIAPLGSYWDKIKALEVVTYKYRDQSHEDDNIGVIAQQVESVAPEFVNSDGFGDMPDDGVPLKSIYEADLHYATLKALQEAMTRIEALEVEVAALKEAAQ
jgi:hypothetical protein